MTQTTQIAAQRFIQQQFPSLSPKFQNASPSTSSNTMIPSNPHRSTRISFQGPDFSSPSSSKSPKSSMPMSTWSIGSEYSPSHGQIHRNHPYIMDPRPIPLGSIKKPPPPTSGIFCISKRIKNIQKKYQLDLEAFKQNIQEETQELNSKSQTGENESIESARLSLDSEVIQSTDAPGSPTHEHSSQKLQRSKKERKSKLKQKASKFSQRKYKELGREYKSSKEDGTLPISIESEERLQQSYTTVVGEMEYNEYVSKVISDLNVSDAK